MDFKLSEEQTLLKDSVDRFLQDEYSLDKRRALIKTEVGFSRKNWKTFADLGWLAMPFAEDSGGLGGGSVETMVLMEAFGRNLVVEPYMHVIVTAASLIEALGNNETKDKILFCVWALRLALIPTTSKWALMASNTATIASASCGGPKREGGCFS